MKIIPNSIVSVNRNNEIKRSNTALYYPSHPWIEGFFMNQDQQPQPWWKWWKDNWPVLALVALAVTIATITGLGYWQRWSWTGLVDIQANLDTKLGWDWLELLIIPILLGTGAFWLTQQARKREQQQRENELEIADQQRRNELEIADQQRKEDSLQRYLDRMQELILDKGLKRSEKDTEIRATARARTLAVLRSLDGDRKGQVVRFLHEAGLIGMVLNDEASEAIIDLRTADLRDANLSFASLGGANLTRTNLSHANLGGANLRGAKGWTNEQLAQAESLVGATLPDGTEIKTVEDWEEFKKLYRQSSQPEEVPKQ